MNCVQPLADADATVALGTQLAAGLEPGMVLYLRGDLGAGKTTLARGLLQGLGHTGRVKSPTFSLVEVYEFSKLYLYHFDFYRFSDPAELDEAGLRDYFRPDAVCLVEWPERAARLPAADLDIGLGIAGTGRTATITATTEAGARCLKGLTG